MTRHPRSIRFATLAIAVLLLSASGAWAQTAAVYVKNDNLGVGNDDPQEDIDLLSSDGDAQILVRETAGPAVQRGLMFLRNNGGVSFVMRNDATSQSWSFGAAASDFLINQQQSGGIEMRLSPGGDLTVEGTVNGGSSRSIKDNIDAIDTGAALDKVLALPVATWSYQADPAQAMHAGPMAEDFYELFGLGKDAKHLAATDVAGVALAAIKGLNERVEQKDVRIAELESRLAQLESLVGSLASR